MAMEQLYGRDQIRRFLKYEQDSYLKARGTAIPWRNSRSTGWRTSNTSTTARARW